MVGTVGKRRTARAIRTRDRAATETGIIKAVGSLLARDGFSALGINALAKEAGVDKVLIYRYFGGMPALLKAFGESGEFWPSFEELTGGNIESLAAKPLSESVPIVLINFARALRRRPITQEIMAWETVEQNELTDVLKKVREDTAVRLFKEMYPGTVKTGADIGAITALLGAAINYLVIRARDTRIFNTVDIRSDNGWRRLEKAIRNICERCFSSKLKR